MKSKKAIKRLTRVEKLLGEVQSQYSAIEKPLGKLISSAKASVEDVKNSIAAKAAQTTATKSKKTDRRPSRRKKRVMAANAKSDGKPVLAFAKRAVSKRSSSKRKPASAKRQPSMQTADTGAAVVS